ncbi:MAG: hypothetical protein ACOCV1_02815 [Bacillota bacterium]
MDIINCNGIVAVFGYILLYIVKKYLKTGSYIIVWLFAFIFMMIIGVVMFAYMLNIYLALFGFLFYF